MSPLKTRFTLLTKCETFTNLHISRSLCFYNLRFLHVDVSAGTEPVNVGDIAVIKEEYGQVGCIWFSMAGMYPYRHGAFPAQPL